MARWRGNHGQASTEYVALIALVATALMLAAGLTSGGVGARVLAGLQRGLCAVAQRGCPRPTPVQADLPPCPLERSSRVESLGGALDFVRLAGGGTLTAVRGSDGRVTVTLADDASAGGEAGVGLGLRLGRTALGGAARVGVSATWTAGRSWTLPSAAAARAFVARYGDKATVGGRVVDELRSRCSLLCDAIGWRPHPQLPPPDATYEEGGALALLTAQLGLDGEPIAAGQARSAAVLGRQVARDGTTTWYLRVASSTVLNLEPERLDGDLRGTAVVSYTLDPAGRPVTLVVHLAGELGASASLAAGGPARARVDAGAARVGELDARLDLHDPANRTAATGLLATLTDPTRLGELPARAAALRRRFGEQGELDWRLYALQRTALGIGGTVALGAELSVGFDRTREGMQLLDAQTRLPGLPFLPRDDCRRA